MMILEYIGLEPAAFKRLIEIEPGRAIAVGRGASCDLVIASPQVARVHAIFCLLPGSHDRVVVSDLKTTNGTVVQGAKVGVEILAPGDEVEIASFRFRVARR